MAGIKKKSSQADMGKWAEGKVQDFLDAFGKSHAGFDWQRMYDARSARGAMPSQIADFEIFKIGGHGVIEVKEVQHDYRLPQSRISQLPRIRKRRLAGGMGIVLVYHSTTKLWRMPPISVLLEEKGASWDLSEFKTYATAEEALRDHTFFNLDQ